MRNNAQPLIAGGTIQPSTFIKLSTSAEKTALAATDGSTSHGDSVIGISQVGSYDTPGLTGAATDAARSGTQIEYFAEGDVCLLKMGTGGCTAGDNLKAASDGTGITATGSGDNVGAKALQTCASGEYGMVQVLIFKI